MLKPEDRSLLLDAIRPPGGYALGQAVGTTYSLNLEALLLAPLSFALFDWTEDEDPNVIALLEAVRRCADDITIFCQSGQISLPRDYQHLLVYLEPRVATVTPLNPDRIFHPKVWALRFVSEEGAPDRFRLLVLSRNLTFDRSWDTVVRLDGEPADAGRRDEVRRQNAPLAEFVGALPDLATRPMEGAERDRVTALADDLREVAWEVPEGFSEMSFHPLVTEQGSWPLPACDRALVVSPFLTAGALRRLAAGGDGHVVVSRGEAFDSVGTRNLGGYEQTFVLTSAAWQELVADVPDGEAGAPAIDQDVGEGETTNEAVAEAAGNELTGLHAKVYVCEHNGRVDLYTGSANATDAAFNGNVEFLVRVRPRDAELSIDGLLEHDEHDTVFRDLLETYRPQHDEPPEETPEERIEADLDRLRRAMGALRYAATVYGLPDQEPGGSDRFGLRLRVDGPRLRELTDELDAIRFWPITLGAGHGMSPRATDDDLLVDFGAVDRRTISAFFAVEITIAAHGLRQAERFVVNAQLIGAPADRRERVIVDLLETSDDVLRYLLFLLSEGGLDARDVLEEMASSASGTAAASEPRSFQAPLFESLVRALVREPDRLNHVARLLEDLRRVDTTRELVPPELDAVWGPIWETRQELET